MTVEYPMGHYRCTRCGHDWPASDRLGSLAIELGTGHVTSTRWGDPENGYCDGPLEEMPV